MTNKITKAVENCINNYSTTLNNFPPEAQKQTSRYYDFDSRHIQILNKLDIFSTKAKILTSADGMCLQRILIDAIDLADRKVEISNCLMHLVEDSVFKLNMDLKNIETAQVYHIDPSEKQSKHPKRILKWVPNYKEIDSDSNDVLNVDNHNEHSIVKTKTAKTSNKKFQFKEKEDSKFQTSKMVSSDNKLNHKNKTKNKSPRTRSSKRKNISESSDIQPSYCICEDISYGSMVCCDNDLCPFEWFHFNCVSLSRKPKGKWFCPKCRGTSAKVMKSRKVFFKELEEYNKRKEEGW